MFVALIPIPHGPHGVILDPEPTLRCQMQLINAGDDGLCGTSDDGDIRSIPADLPTQYVRNGTAPRMF